ncbi:Geranylgeranyl transferase type-2 subunit alpha [Daldinia childiae]|uniref:Geranylgeranyl transferase type-2 subunit alpha n=1 Tax=Daldinia childiae TaxID=326645 RepID=UPI001447ED93|nr:Geranylgeranyl transferase type-2 subunit alpha [Daldinia childiae]KAF3070583.1 Geranylgeranyl transferase type-2 subunit alpha [Daldinia childiae]
MDSHGAARTARTARTEEQRRQDLDRISKYRDLEDSIRTQALADNYDSALFQLTSKLLRLNPEYYTIWNVRRRCLISGLFSAPSDGSSLSKASLNTSQNDTMNPSSDYSSHSSSDVTPLYRDSPITGKNGTIVEDRRREDVEADVNTLQSELSFTIPLLLEYPKCYWIWKYRRWLLEQAIVRLPATTARNIWEAELALASKMLTKDRRNFHAWGYRRNVVATLESSSLDGKSMVEDEFAYTTRMINVDLSNFSAWHTRSQLILRLLDERGANDVERREFLEAELDLVREALNVGPEDQSLWYYHQYMVSQIVNRANKPTIAPALTVTERVTYVKKEIDNIKDLLEDYEDVKWIYESLLEYTIALKGLGVQVEDPAKWLVKVRALDPMRAGRWDDIEKQLGAAQH